MRKILATLAILLTSAILTLGWDSDEQNQLSFTASFEVPGASPEQLREWADDWFYSRVFFNSTDTMLSRLGIDDNIFSFTFGPIQLRRKQHVISANVSIACFSGHYIVEIINIRGICWCGDVMSGDRYYMTSDGSMTTRFPFPGAYRRNYWKIRQSIEEDFFPRLCASIHRSMLEHAELDL